jgi:hypothetical protein
VHAEIQGHQATFQGHIAGMLWFEWDDMYVEATNLVLQVDTSGGKGIHTLPRSATDLIVIKPTTGSVDGLLPQSSYQGVHLATCKTIYIKAGQQLAQF